MDKIDGLCEDELVKILSYLPTRTAVSTSVLSKRWKYLWKRVSKLEYDDSDNTTNESKKNFRLFVETNLPIERESELESLRFSFRSNLFQPQDIKSFVEIAVSRGIRDLSITNSFPWRYNWHVADILPYCKSLVALKLEDNILLQPFVCFPSLKTLQLRSVKFSSTTLQSFLSDCPVLENLIVEHSNCYNLREISVRVPSSLKYFKVEDRYSNCHSYLIGNMPKLEEASINVMFGDIKKFLEPITFVKHLTLCLTVKSAKDEYSDGVVFNHLEHLKLCTCNKYWSELLVWFLQDSPNLRVIEFYLNEHHSACRKAPVVSWKNHLHAQCFATSLETFKWIGYEGTKKERKLLTYILNTARYLKTATIILTDSRIDNPQKKLVMISELKLSSAASTTCKLVFV